VPRQVPAVVRALDILELFLRQSPPPALSVPEIAAALSLPRSTAHELVGTLVARRYLQPDAHQPHRFTLGVRLFELGNAYAAGLDLAREGQLVAQQVAAQCGETVHVAVLDGIEVFYIAKVDSTNPVRLVSAIGKRLPAHCTAVGKMLLSGLADHELEERYRQAGGLVGMTPNSITSLAALKAELAATRRRGLAYDNCESNLDARCVAAPVYDHEGQMVAAMSISFPIIRDDPVRILELAQLIRQGARALSERLGYRGTARFDGAIEPPPWHQAAANAQPGGGGGKPRG
jgi:IclR family KDG regulon transcriptional repressor